MSRPRSRAYGICGQAPAEFPRNPRAFPGVHRPGAGPPGAGPAAFPEVTVAETPMDTYLLRIPAGTMVDGVVAELACDDRRTITTAETIPGFPAGMRRQMRAGSATP